MNRDKPPGSLPITAAVMLPMAWAAIVLTGCSPTTQEAPTAKPPEVVVAQPIVKEDAPSLQFTGRTEAINRVDVKARVSGYLEKVAFADGASVKQGDLLFQIDPRPYQATLAQTEAAVAEAKAALEKADADMRRAEPLVASRAISREEYDLRVAQRSASLAAVQSAEAQVDAAKLDLEFTSITAPISGRIGKANVTVGNLVSETEGVVLTTIVQIDPVYVYFDVDERSLLEVKATRAAEGKELQAGDVSAVKMPIEVGLVSDAGFPHHGFLDFVDNSVNPATGTLQIRGIISNPTNPLPPGLFVRVRAKTGNASPTTFVAERALGIDQGQRFLYVVDGDDKVQYKAVVAGASDGGLRRIESGLTPDAWVVVNGVQRVRPGIVVTAERAKMTDFAPGQATASPPTSTAPTADSSSR